MFKDVFKNFKSHCMTGISYMIPVIVIGGFGSLTLAHSQNSQMSFMYGFFFVKFLFFTVVCVVIVI